MPLIEVKDMCFHYNEAEPILQHMDIRMDSQSTAIVGQNGAGKTTFVKLLKGLLRPVSGAVFFDGQDLASMTVAQIARHIGLVFQNPNDQIFKNRVRDEVMFGPLNIGMSEAEAEKQAKAALEMVGLGGSAERNPNDMGLSERKLIAIASIVAMDTDVIIFDEPTIAQDYKGKETIKGIIRELRSRGKLVLTIIHDMDFVAECFERTLVFAKGKVLLDGPTAEVFSHEAELKTAYLETPHVTQLCSRLGYDEVFLTVEDFVEQVRQQNKG